MFDFVVIGDVLIDRILRIADPGIIRSINEATHTVAFPFPSKVQLTVPPHTGGGGNAYNSAHALQKLGLSTAVYSMVGTDYEGGVLTADLKRAGINADMVAGDPANATNSSVVLSIAGDKVLFSYHYDREYSLPVLPETKYVYLTSLGENDKPLFDAVVAQKQAKNFQLVFSPGTRQVSEPLQDVRDVLQVTDYLVLNKEEAKKLSRLNSDSNETLLKALAGMGPKVVVITRAQHGAIAFDGTNILKVGVMPVDVIEVTGAGDTFSATMAAGLSLGKDLKTAMEWGSVNAAAVIGQVGGVAGLLDMPTLTKNHADNISKLQYIEPT